ncbi:MAG: SDR family NAD(P)-dependent oxidoreductase [Kofleriaceae bacterium]
MSSSSDPLAGRHVLVTGGSGSLGRGVVRVLQDRGATVHVSPDPPALHLDDEAQTVALFATLPPLWASVHLVGGFAMSKLVDTSLADLEAQWRINAVTCFLCCREAARNMIATGDGGRIVNVAARAALVPPGGMAAYVAGKAAVVGLTQSIAAELAADRILVNAIAPSIIDTPANRAAMPAADHASWPTPDQIAEAIAYLVSPHNSLTSGAVVPVYGRA